MHIHILSKQNMLSLAPHICTRHAIIGIDNPGKDTVYPGNPYRIGLQKLQFRDLDYGQLNDSNLPDDILYQSFNRDFSNAIIDFAKDYRALGITDLYIHCEMGISRSATIAYALSLKLNLALPCTYQNAAYLNHFIFDMMMK